MIDEKLQEWLKTSKAEIRYSIRKGMHIIMLLNLDGTIKTMREGLDFKEALNMAMDTYTTWRDYKDNKIGVEETKDSVLEKLDIGWTDMGGT